MELAVFFHCWTAGRWRPITHEFLHALNESGFPGQLYVGLVGSPAQRAEALAEIRAVRPAEVAAEADNGFEQVTIHPLHDYAKHHGGVVVYGHTKGSWHGGNRSEVAAGLCERIVRRWRSRLLSLLLNRADVTGDPDNNFWMATCDFVRALPPCRTHDDNGQLGRGYAQAGTDGGWFLTGSRKPRAVPALPILTRTGFRADGQPTDPLWSLDHVHCHFCGSGQNRAEDPRDSLVIDGDGQPIFCERATCPFASVGHRLLELQAMVDHPLDLEDLAGRLISPEPPETTPQAART